MPSIKAMDSSSHHFQRATPAYFKHYAHKSAQREVVALYDVEGKPLEVYETSAYTPEGKAIALKWWYRHWQSKCNDSFPSGQVGWWEIPGMNELLIIKQSQLAGITGIQAGNGRAKELRPRIDKRVIEQLLREIETVRYCSAFKRSLQDELKHHFPSIAIADLIVLLAQSIAS